MGEKERDVIRVVLDTNVLISALLFSGELGQIVEGWKTGAFVPFFSRETFDEFRRVLSYPKFSLTVQEIATLIEDEVLPYCEIVEIGEEILRVCRDPADDPFLSCAVAASADFIISGDKDLLTLGSFRNIPIVTATAFLQRYK
ncbi:MAG: putative toxin-antitoxin system toxin component, PIN family [Syntrophus sp. RIFOXYC2_FULL_54_9]|nr:MAG: putative toxin-antitoxin system toxin component, PIN family [Syntrophus sp. GWC2_56_31]OHE31905.1 MAG: putative toxin-antitoxin system toxin component, PIN family [Syntrophus sp. RIFOXYC2_FULL_54_9]